MESHRIQVESPPPPSQSNFIIAMTLQLPMSLKATERTSPRGIWRTGARNGI